MQETLRHIYDLGSRFCIRSALPQDVEQIVQWQSLEQA